MRTMKNGAIAALCLVAFAVGFAHNGIAAGQDNEPAASVTIGGVTTEYASLMDAWTYAINNQNLVDVTVKLLKDATVEKTLVRNVEMGVAGWTMTLDLNDHVLAYGGASDACVVHQNGGRALHIVDTATTRTPRYFTCDETTGLWALTNEETDLSVSGGLITGGRAGAVNVTYGPNTNVIRNVNLVGNRSTANGGAVSASAGTMEISKASILGNVAGTDGGGIYATKACHAFDSRIGQNVAGGRGGGAFMGLNGLMERTEIVGNKAATGGGVYLSFYVTPCFPAGVKIRMADGAEKNVEEVAVGDVVATFDHVGGTNSSEAVYYVYRGVEASNAFTLAFASGATLDIVGCHGLLMEATRKYVTVSYDNARSYVGSRFYNYATGAWDALTAVTPAKGDDAHYSLYTRGHINCVANGMLTVPNDKDFYLNVYELDENLKADADILAADIAAYGLATPADYPNIPLDDFADGNMRYARIAIAKGLTTQEDILFWNEFDYGPVVAKRANGALKLTTSSVAEVAVAPADPYLQVGEGVVVTGNVSAAGTDNVYLMPSVVYSTPYKPVIDILPDTENLDIGVTLSTGIGVFGWTNDVNYASSFTSDNPDYAVAYTADKTLALRAGIQVGDDAWALINAGSCSVSGTGDMWSYAKPADSKLWDYRSAITNVVIADAVQSVGTNAFAYQKGIRDVTIGAGVTNVCEDAFFSCLNVTNLAVGAGVRTVGASAFGRCNSLTDLSFGSKAVAEACQGKAFKIVARITMNGGDLVIDAVPKVTIAGYTRTLFGAEVPTGPWTAIADESNIPSNYHFFKYEYVEEQ